MSDILKLNNHEFTSRFLLGTGKFSIDKTAEIINASGTQLVTLALRRANNAGDANILDKIPSNTVLLPNTSGARSVDEAVRIAHLSRELGCGDFIKIEIIRDSKYLLPDNNATVEATKILAAEGFVVLPYVSADLYTARALKEAGAAAIMPLAAPIGSNRGLLAKDFIKILIEEIDLPIIVDAGIGKPSDACLAMELGASACLINTAVASASDPVLMATAFKEAIIAGRNAYLAGLGRVLDKGEASSPLTGFLND
ncbi:MAG: thiazole synthase [Erysipelotrichaceae bacterium]